jgi:hypothetical protein
MKEKYIGITQGCAGTIQINDQDSSILGLYTEKIKTCLGIVLLRQDGKVSLFHYDGRQSTKSISEWLVDGLPIIKCDVWYNPYYASNKEYQSNIKTFNSLTHLLKATAISFMKITTIDNSDYGGGYIYIDFSANLASSGNIDWHPQKQVLHPLNMLNGLMNDGIQEVPIYILYNNKAWLNLPLKVCFDPNLLKDTDTFLDKMIQSSKEEVLTEQGLTKKTFADYLNKNLRSNLDTYIPIAKRYIEQEKKQQQEEKQQPPPSSPEGGGLENDNHQDHPSQVPLSGLSPVEELD